MNKKIFQKGVGQIRRLRPIPLSLIDGGQNYEDDPWTIVGIDDSYAALKNHRTGREFRLGLDHVREFRTPDQILLRSQIIIRTEGVHLEPILPPPDFSHFEIALLRHLSSVEWYRLERANFFHVSRLIEQGFIEFAEPPAGNAMDPRSHFGVRITDRGVVAAERILGRVVLPPSLTNPESPLPAEKPYKYTFDDTVVGDWSWTKRDYRIIQDAFLELLASVQKWNYLYAKDGEEQPYEEEASDLVRMIRWGENRLAEDDEPITISGTSVGSLRYTKAALSKYHGRLLKKLSSKTSSNRVFPLTASLKEKLAAIQRMINRIPYEPSELLKDLPSTEK